MLRHYFPSGILGLGFTALMASFMSGMAGNVTAFNTVWTYDIYQAYLRPKSDAIRTSCGWAARRRWSASSISVAAAYFAAHFNNIMDMLQLVFAFVNAPLFATFLLGMFWRRATGHGAFFGLLSGILAAALHHGLTQPTGAMTLRQGRLARSRPAYLSQRNGAEFLDRHLCLDDLFRGDNSYFAGDDDRQKSDAELTGLVWSLTPRIWKKKRFGISARFMLGIFVLVLALILNIIFW